MDKTHKRRWIKALRSGKYEYFRRCPRLGDKYNVFGILYDINMHIINSNWQLVSVDDDGTNQYFPWTSNFKEHSAKFFSSVGLLEKERLKLQKLDYKSFEVAADWIEKNI